MREWLVDFRIKKGFTQKKVADLAGISRSYYSGIELGTRNASVEAAQAIAIVLGFDWTLFFAQTGRKSRHGKKRPA